MGRYRESLDGQLEDLFKIDERDATVIERWLERINTLYANHRRQRTPALDPDDWGGIPGYPNQRNREAALEKVADRLRDKYGYKVHVEDFVVDSEPYGDQTIGVKIDVPGIDVYESLLAYTFDDEQYVITNWGDEWEQWEEDQYNKDPWPKIEHDQPQGQEDIYTGDFVHFYVYRSGYSMRKMSWSQVPVEMPDKSKDRLAFALPLDPDDDPHPDDTPGYWDLFEDAMERARARASNKDYWAHYGKTYFWQDRGHDWMDLHHPPDEWFAARRERIRREDEARQAAWKRTVERQEATMKMQTSAQYLRNEGRQRTGAMTYTQREERRTRAGAWMQRRNLLISQVIHRPVPKRGDLFTLGRGANGEATFYRVGDGVPVLVVTDFEIAHGIALEKVKRAARTGVVWRAYRGVSHLDWKPIVLAKGQGFHGLSSRKRQRRRRK